MMFVFYLGRDRNTGQTQVRIASITASQMLEAIPKVVQQLGCQLARRHCCNCAMLACETANFMLGPRAAWSGFCFMASVSVLRCSVRGAQNAVVGMV